MKIAIVAPSPIPFGMGGAEKLWLGLQNNINKRSPHQCELLKVPTREHSFWDLVDSYQQFYSMDLNHFDLLVSGKYPAWMVPHPNHRIYMAHCLRGLYDTYRTMRLPWDCPAYHPKVVRLLRAMENGDFTIQNCFDFLGELKNEAGIPAEAFQFPGPFIRKVIHFLDKKAMAQIKSFAAISHTVANRKEYYPEGKIVTVVYPPSNLESFKTGGWDYFFAVSRLDGPKRMKMIVEAYLRAETSIPLKIAGTGPEEEALKNLARGDSRIHLLGFVSDQELIDYYANAFAVIFIPYEEDYGFITLEAMMSAKPVITFSDSGGVTEFVEEGKTGVVCPPGAGGLRKAIEALSLEKAKVMEMGRRAREKVEYITWDYTIGELVEEREKAPAIKKMSRKIAVLSTFPVYPPRGGGQNGIYFRYRELAKFFQIEMVCLTHEREQAQSQEVAPQFREIRIPKSLAHAAQEWIIQRKAKIPITDIALFYLYEKTPAFVEAVKKATQEADFVVCAHPYSYPLAKKYGGDKKIIHESHNMEYLLKKQMLPPNPTSERLLKKLFEVEKQACLETALTTVVSMEDAQAMHQLYGLDMQKVLAVPSGVDLDSVSFTSPQARLGNKRTIGMEKVFTALFVGSWHQPNIEAVERILEMADARPDVMFLIMGSVGLYFKDKVRKRNLGFLGVVDDAEKDFILGMVDVALNPMISGSGINLKLLDYMAAGIPVITTPFGVRGLNIPPGLVTLSEISDFARVLSETNPQPETQRGREFVEKHYSWPEVCKRLVHYYSQN